MKRTTSVKRILSLFCAVLMVLTLSATAFAASGPSSKDLEDINSHIEFPKANEYLADYEYAVVKAPKGHSVFGYGSADRAGHCFTVLDGEEVMIIGERKGMSCCIILSSQVGRWINSKYLVRDGEETGTPEPAAATVPDGPSAMDLTSINSHIEFPKTGEYLADYEYAVVKAPKGHSVFGYGSADRAGHCFTVLDGEEVMIIGERKGMSCCIVLSSQVGRWINSDYLVSAN